MTPSSEQITPIMVVCDVLGVSAKEQDAIIRQTLGRLTLHCEPELAAATEQKDAILETLGYANKTVIEQGVKEARAAYFQNHNRIFNVEHLEAQISGKLHLPDESTLTSETLAQTCIQVARAMNLEKSK